MDSIARTPAQIGSTIRRARRKMKLSQAALGARTGLRQATISRIETGSSAANIDTIMAILAVLRLEIVIRPRTRGSIDDIGNLFR